MFFCQPIFGQECFTFSIHSSRNKKKSVRARLLSHTHRKTGIKFIHAKALVDRLNDHSMFWRQSFRTCKLMQIQLLFRCKRFERAILREDILWFIMKLILWIGCRIKHGEFFIKHNRNDHSHAISRWVDRNKSYRYCLSIFYILILEHRSCLLFLFKP